MQLYDLISNVQSIIVFLLNAVEEIGERVDACGLQFVSTSFCWLK